MKINEKNLCIFATTPPYDYEGFLNKRGVVNKAFQRRYFVLKGNLLFYFEKKGDREPLGLIIVEGCTIELSEECDQYCFQIVFNGNRSYTLCADNQEVMEAWMKVLTCAGYEYKKLMVADLQRQLDEIEDTKKNCLKDNLESTTPKPPPRRQNPFNRPAPLPPQITSEMVFINGTSGLVPVHAETTPSGSITAPPRSLRGAARNSPTGSTKSLQKLPASTILFRKLHEKLRKEVMVDIELYLAQKELAEKPLIEI